MLSFPLNLDTIGEEFLECVVLDSDFLSSGEEREFKAVGCGTPAEGSGECHCCCHC